MFLTPARFSYVIRLPLLHDVVVVWVVVAAVDVVGHLQELRIVVPGVGVQSRHPPHSLRQLLDHGVERVLEPSRL